MGGRQEVLTGKQGGEILCSNVMEKENDLGPAFRIILGGSGGLGFGVGVEL